jgi:hypothetical protein
VQVQVLELLRTRRIFTRISVQTAPKPFLLVAVLSSAPVPTTADRGGFSLSHSCSRSAQPPPLPLRSSMTGLIPHLNDYFFLAHRHDAQLEGFAHLDEESVRTQTQEQHNGGHRGDSGSSVTSVLQRGELELEKSEDALFSEDVSCCAHRR